MEHLGWFFAGTSIGLFIGVFAVSLARVAGMASEQEFADVKASGSRKLLLVRR